ncbi:Putative transporter AmpG 4 [Halomicronema hongdechloris C2206]|uniref:Transporter AmpG 4 n=1 Tax=Halomicronema hongdechloris C2206 TaxID=1641165 RepID=A0A1Z3HQP3_9CYAN|nr:MFS transporter [Halomicronema hongdechloris]ASC72639.1 Putative transporter AmpG 4 [Halomicronema hongdechloris C2206]
MASQSHLKKYGLLGSLYVSQFLPFWFLYEALPVLLRQQGMSLQAIGLLPLVAIAMTFKFLWAPLIDRYSVARWGHYRFWIIAFQLWVVGITLMCSGLNLETQLPVILIGLALMGTGCASQDIATDALALRLLEPQERGMGNAVQGVGGSLGKMIGGGGLLIVLNQWGWRLSLWTLAAAMLLALLPVLLHREPRRPAAASALTAPLTPGNYGRIFWQFCRRPGMLGWLLILGLYAAAHNLSATMFRPLLVDQGLSLAEIGSLLGVGGTTMTMVGALAAGIVISRWGRKRSLLIATSLAFLGVLSYFLPTFGLTQLPVLYGIVGITFLALGMIGTTTFTIMMDNSRPEMAGTDYTLQTSLIGISGIIASALSGVLAAAIGYRGVFTLSALLLLGCITFVAKGFKPTPAQPAPAEDAIALSPPHSAQQRP